MERLFQVLAVVLILVAAVFYWLGNKDAVFVLTVLGCVSFAISMRFQVKERLNKRKAEESLETESDVAKSAESK